MKRIHRIKIHIEFADFGPDDLEQALRYHASDQRVSGVRAIAEAVGLELPDDAEVVIFLGKPPEST